jgi:hypothetical protein
MFESTESVISGIHKLGLPAVFEKICAGDGPERFVLQYAAPRRFFLIKKSLAKLNHNVENYLPILEMNEEAIYAYDFKKNIFVEYFYEDNEPTTVGLSYQQFIAGIFVDLGYSGLIEIVSEVYEIFHFKYYKELVNFLEEECGGNGGDSEAEKFSFLESIAALESL